MTISILRLQQRLYFRLIERLPAIPEEKFSFGIGEAQRVDSRDQKIRVPSDILKWDNATILFWVDLNDELASSGNNRYLFSYTTDVLDSTGHPNGFYLFHCGGTNRWEFRFYRDPIEKEINYIAFENAPNILGIRLVAIRWCRQERYCELLLDAGISFRKRITLASWASFPCASSEAIHFGGWRDNWDGGLSRTLFTGIRIYDQPLSDKELLTIYKEDKKKTLRLFGVKD